MAGSSTWSYDTLREKADKGWTLAGDDQVLRLMMKIGKNLESRTVSVTQQIDQMLVNVDRTCIQLENVNNKLVALQKTHFFDHQIQEDNEYLQPASTSAATQDTVDRGKLSKADAEEVLKKVLKDTVNAVDKCYEKIVLDWSDSILDEEDDVIGRTMIRPMDVYKDLPRPYLIGSDKWRKSKYVGLKEEDPEEEVESVRDETQSNQWSVEDSQYQPEAMDSGSTTSSDFIKADPVIAPESLTEPAIYSERFFRPPDLSSDLRQIQEEERKHETITQPTQISSPSVFFDETPPVVAQGSLTAIRKKPNLFADLEDDDDDDGFGDATPATIVNPKGYKTQVNLFDDEPPEMEERVSGATAKSRGLFDDNVDGDLAKAHSTVPGKKPINLFDDDAIEDDLFAPKRARDPETVTPKVVKSEQPIKRNEDILNNNNDPTIKGETKKSATLDENKNPVLKSSQNDTFKQSMEEMLRRGIGGGNKLNTSRPTSINNDMVEEEVITKPREVITPVPVGVKTQLPKLNTESDNYNNPAQPPKDQTKKKSVVPRGLFDDLDDEDTDDLFSSAPKQNIGQLPKERPKVNKPTPVKSKGLFDDDTEHDDLFGPTPGHLILKPEDRPQQKSVPQEPVKDYKAVASKYKSRGLFDDDSEEEDLFKPKPSQQVEKKEKNVLSKSTETNVGTASKANLFGDKEEEDLFASNPNQTKATLSSSSKAPKKASLFDDSGDDDDLFGPKTSTSNESKLIEEKNRLEAESKRQKAQEEALKLEEEKRKAAEEQAKFVKIKEEQEEIKRVQKENEKKRLDEEKEKLRLEAEEQKRLQELEDNKQKEIEREQKRLKEEDLQQLEQERIKKEAEEQHQKKLAEEEKLRNLAAEEEERNRKEKERVTMEKDAEFAQTREASKKSTLFDDLDDEEDFFEEIVQKPSQESFSTSVSMFDEPPEDNHYNPTTVSVAKIPHFEDGESSEDDNLFAGKKPNPILQASTAKKSIDLFSDLPPEDDQEDLFASMPKSIDSVTQKKDVFYDDMAESFPPQEVDKSIKQENKSLSSSMLEVVVPEDDMDDVFAKESPVKSIKKSETIQSVRDLIKSHENPVEQLPTEPSTRKSLPNKLNTNLVINVNAILPGARPPPMAKRMSLDSFEDVPKTDNNEVSPDKALNSTSPSIGVSTPVDQNVNQNSATLSSLNKGRPKATSNRRPSTRKGRQESLRRSQLFDDSEGVPAEDAEASIDQPSQVVEDIKPVPVQSTNNPIEVATPIFVKQEAPTKTRKLFDSDDDEDSDDLFKPKSVTLKAPEVHKKEVPKREVIKKDVPKPKQTSLFSDDGDSDGDLFSSSSAKAVSSAKSSTSKAAVKKEASRTSTDHNPLADLF